MRGVALFLLVLTMAVADTPTTPAVIQRPVTNLFSKPTVDADVVSQAIFGWNVQVLEEQPEWLKIRTPDEYTGWIEASAALKRDVYAVSGTVAKVKTLFGGLYRESSITKHQPLLTLPFEARLEVLSEPESENRRWVQVRLPDQREAWIQRGDIGFDQKPMTREEMLMFSRRFLGLPYLWGGVSSFGYDCSGFTQMLFRQTGASMPRDAQPQAEWAGVVPVAKEELQPGDLLYFGSSDKKITHTGLFIGDGQFIHATAHVQPVVQISNLGDPHWADLLVATRRMK
jgi:hypothetical protein